MKKEHYHVYCNGILGVKTDISGFKWIYGSTAPETDFDKYNECCVKFEVYLKLEKDLGDAVFPDCKFQSFAWDDTEKTIFYRRTLFKNINIGYNIRILGNTVVAEIGNRYWKYVKNRVMNLHGIYYLLSDLANLILLKNGYLTFYSSSVHYEPKSRGLVFFAASGAGKTLTATNLCKKPGYKLVSEDVTITDGKRLFSCPWTNSYRGKGGGMDSAGSLKRIQKSNEYDFCEVCKVTDLLVLTIGKEKIDLSKEELLRQICVFNGYLFNYFSSPIVKVLELFDKDYCKPWQSISEKIISDMLSGSEGVLIYTASPTDFCTIVHNYVTGKEK